MKNKFFSIVTAFALMMTVLYPLGALPALADTTNLVSNPSLEDQSGGLPTGWHQGQWGVNECEFTYPVAGVDSGSAAKVDVSSHSSGDCKWYFNHVAVSANYNYRYSDQFLSDAPSELVAEYIDTDGYLSYSLGIVIPASGGSWQTATAIFAPPAGTVSMTIFHVLAHVGALSIDDVNLQEVIISDPFDEGMVSLTFDDGFTDQYLNAFPKLKAADIKGTFYLATHSNQGLSIPDTSLIAASPTSWNFAPTSVLPDLVYEFNEQYKSNADSELAVSLELNNGSTINADITDINGSTLGQKQGLSSSADIWKSASLYFYTPVDAKKATVINSLQGVGELAIDNLNLGVVGHMTKSQITEMLVNGEEFGGHSRTHLNLTALAGVDQSSEIQGSREDLINNIIPALSFAYPYGAYDNNVKELVANAGYISARTVTPGFNGKGTDKFALYSQSIDSSTSLNTIKDWVQQAIAEKSWLILTFHGISSDSGSYFAITPEKFQEIIDYLKSTNVKITTVNEGVALMSGSTESAHELVSISITSPADKLEYTVGDALDISGLSVTGLYSDSSTMSEVVSTSNIFGFDSSAPATNQILTINIKGKSTSYAINITAPVDNGGDNHGDNSNSQNKSFSGGSSPIIYCQEAKYVCINNVKNIVSQTPATCSFTAAQLARIDEPCTNNNNEQPAQQVLGIQKYAVGTLLRSKLNQHIYVVVDETSIKYILNFKELSKYKGHTRIDVDESVIAAYSQVLGVQKYADGTLVRTRGDHKIYVIVNGEKVHIKTLKGLAKYIGQPILNIE